MSDILTRLLLDTKGYDSNLMKAKKSTNDFASSITGKLVGAATKLAGGIGLAMGAAEAFNKVINSSQTLGDKWNNTLSSCKGTVDAFFQSLSTGSWDAFNGGLLATLRNMMEVAAMKDMLEDAKLSMGFETKEFEREYVRLEGIIDNEKLGKAEREAAFADMQNLIANFKGKVEKTAQGAADTLVKEMNAKFGQNFTLSDLEKYIKEVNNEFLNTETLQRLNEYKAKLESFNDGRSQVINGYVLTKEQFIAQNAELEKMRILQDDNDESRKNMLAQLEYAVELQRRVDEYLKRHLEKQNKIANLNKPTGGTGNVNKKANLPVTIGQVNYDTPLGQKVLEWMNGKEFKPIHVPIVIEEEVDEEDLSGKWAEHLTKEQKKVEDMNNALASTADIFGSLGSIAASSGNDFLAATMQSMGSIAQMIMQLQALSTAQGAASASKLPFPANIAAIATVVATIASVFASLPKFAEGGIVGGSSYFGDKLLARLNSGEAVLTQQQQSKALSLMDRGNNVRVSGDVRLSGKDIFISLRNYMSSTGNRL